MIQTIKYEQNRLILFTWIEIIIPTLNEYFLKIRITQKGLFLTFSTIYNTGQT